MTQVREYPQKATRVSLEGKVVEIKPLSRAWHVKFAPRNYERKRPKMKKCFEIVTQFGNPYDPKDPVVVKQWPITEENLDGLIVGQKDKGRFFAYKDGIYSMCIVPKGHTDESYLRGHTRNASPILGYDEVKFRTPPF